MTKSLKDATDKGAPADKLKELREEQAYVFFQQYLVANQAEDIEKSIHFISKQTECQIEIFGEKSSQVCSNLFLTGQFQMKLGRYKDALKNSEKVMQLCQDLKEEFGEDYPIVASKFYMQQGKLAFVMNKLDAAEQAAEQGIVLVKQVKTTEEDIKKASDHTQRDLLNLLVRVKAKKEGRDASIVRKEIADKYSMGTTFLEIHDKQQERLQQIHEALRIEINKKEKEAKQQQ